MAYFKKIGLDKSERQTQVLYFTGYGQVAEYGATEITSVFARQYGLVGKRVLSCPFAEMSPMPDSAVLLKALRFLAEGRKYAESESVSMFKMSDDMEVGMPLLPGIIKSLFETEDSSTRFENICIDLYNQAEGEQLVPTSRTWDRGRDARSASIKKQEQPIAGVLCATLNAGLDSKLESDIKRLSETTQTTSIVYCSSKSLSEHECDKIEAKIRKIYPAAQAVRALGQIQIAALAERYEQITRKYYAAEIHNIEQALFFQPSATTDPQHIGLRLALMTQTGDDARLLRSELTRRLVLDNLHATGSKSPGRLAQEISAQLHLSRSISGNYVNEILSELNKDGLISISDDKASLEPKGVEYVKEIPQEASNRLLEGRVAVRTMIKTLSGHDLPDLHYVKVWNTFQDGLSNLFYSHGSAIVRMVGSLITGQRIKPEESERVLLEQLGDKILPLFSDLSQGNEVRQAIIDMFSEKDTVAFEWLSQKCSVYVMMCSLGFEALSSQEVTSTLQGFRLVADSDVVLSQLCEGEQNHDEVVRILNAWKALGGKLSVATPILEEVAYHAWISEHDYISMADQLDQISDDQANHLIGNAFVRTFRRLSKGKTGRKYWQSYIKQYRGLTEYDYGPLLEILRSEYGFDLLPGNDSTYDAFKIQVQNVLIKRASEDARCKIEDLDYRTQDKCRRDGIVIASIKAARDAAYRAGLGGSTIILSSARLLKEADEVFKTDLGAPDAVVSTAGLCCLLTLTPGIQMGLGTLRGVLFDLGLAERLTPMQRYAYRLIASSGEYDLPWSKRVTLQRELGLRILKDAKASDTSKISITKRVLRSEDPTYSAKIVADALDRMAVTPETQKEIKVLRQEVKRLKEEIAKSRRV